MKKILVLLAILTVAMFVLAGCGKQVSAPDEPETEPEATAPEPAPVKQVVKAAEPEPEPEVVETAPAPAKTPTKKVADLLKKHSRVTSLSYMYQDQLNYPKEWSTWVQGSKVAVDIREAEEVSEDVYVNKIYMDTLSKTAKGYCEQSIYRCKDPNQAVDVKYARYARKTPIDWIKEVTYAESQGEETRQQRIAMKLVYEDEDGAEVTMWVDDYYGVPMEVWVKSGGATKKYIYEDLSINGVSSSDLEHRFITASSN